MSLQAELAAKRVTDDGIGFVHDGALVYLNGASGFPNRFAQRLAAEGKRLRDVQVFHPMLHSVAKGLGMPVAKFIRDAVLEKLARHDEEAAARYRDWQALQTKTEK